jgi:hypothetical protein
VQISELWLLYGEFNDAKIINFKNIFLPEIEHKILKFILSKMVRSYINLFKTIVLLVSVTGGIVKSVPRTAAIF